MFDISSLFDMLKQGGAATQPGPTDGSIPIPTANPNGPGLPAPMAAPMQPDPQTTASTTPQVGAGVLSGLGQSIGTNDGKGGASTFGGLLNFKNDDNKQAFLRGLLASSGSLMQAGAPSDHPTSFLGNVGGALAAGTGAYDGYGQNKAQLANASAQTAHLNAETATGMNTLASKQKADAIRAALFGGGAAPFNGGSNAGATNVPATAGAPVGGVLGAPPAAPTGAPTSGVLAPAGATPTSPAAPNAGAIATQINKTRALQQNQYNGLMSVGDGENARAIYTQMNLADNKAAEHGLIWDGTKYTAAPGFNEGLTAEKQAEATGTSIGNRQAWTDDQKEVSAINQDNAKAGKDPISLETYLAAKRPDGATGDMKNLVVINQQRVAAGQPALTLEQYQESQKSNTVVTSDGKGGVTVTQGPGAKGQSLTESQTASATFLSRGLNALKLYDGADGDSALTSTAGKLTNGVPIVGPVVTSEAYQLANNSKMEMIRALLRKESGAAIGPDEYRTTDQTYFPQANDPPSVVAQKKNLREEAINSLGYGVPDATLKQIKIEGQKSDAGSMPTVSNATDYANLKSGTIFTQNGKRFKKP